MQYRVTSTSAEGTTRLACSEPAQALELAREASAEGRSDVWIADDEGRLYTAREFERFLEGRT
jgi:hypothetical protein